MAEENGSQQAQAQPLSPQPLMHQAPAEKTRSNEARLSGLLGRRENAIRVFEEHIAEVKRIVPEERLLVFDVSKDGWVRIATGRSMLSGTPTLSVRSLFS